MPLHKRNHRKTPEKQLDDHFKITDKNGHHDPSRRHRGGFVCPCEPETGGGYSYRDHVAESTNHQKTKWDRIRFYHHAPIVKKNGNIIRVNTHGYGNHSTTRERINRELPRGFMLRQKDYEVKLELPNGDLIDVPRKFDIQPIDQSIRKPNGDLILHYTEE